MSTTFSGTGSIVDPSKWSAGLPTLAVDAIVNGAATMADTNVLNCLTLTATTLGSITMDTAINTNGVINVAGSVTLTAGSGIKALLGNITLNSPTYILVHGVGVGLAGAVQTTSNVIVHDTATGFSKGTGNSTRSAMTGAIIICDQATGITEPDIATIPSRFSDIPVSGQELLPGLICGGLRSGNVANPGETNPAGTLANPSYLIYCANATSQSQIVINGPTQFDGADYDFGCHFEGAFGGLIFGGEEHYTNSINFLIEQNPLNTNNGIGLVFLGISDYDVISTATGGLIWYAVNPVSDDWSYPIAGLDRVLKATTVYNKYFGISGTASGGSGGGGGNAGFCAGLATGLAIKL